MDNPKQQRAGFVSARIVHLHPTRFCNLACQHCYSQSGPDQKHHLPLEPILNALTLLKEEGYDTLSLSGGEPLLYQHFEDLVRQAKEMGYRITMISNGAAIKGKRLDTICEYIDFITISLDGRPEVHNQMRGNDLAFQWAESAMQRLRDREMPFGISYCVSKLSLIDMPWVAEFADNQQAALLQYHLFADTGRGEELDILLGLSDTECARVYTIAEILKDPEGPFIQVDLVPTPAAILERHAYPVLQETGSSWSLSDLANPIIINEEGWALPFTYGMNMNLAIANIKGDFAADCAIFKQEGAAQIRALLETGFDQLEQEDLAFVDWFYHLECCSYGRVGEAI